MSATLAPSAARPSEPPAATDELNTRFDVDRLGDGTIKEFRVTSTQSFWSGVDPLIAVWLVCAFAYQLVMYQCLVVRSWSLGTALTACALAALSKLGRVQDESVLVVKELGVQLKKRYFTGRERNLFIDVNRIESVVINESFHRCQVIFYLAFRERGRETVHLAFAELIPRLHVLVRVLRGIRAVLYAESESG